MTNHRTTLTTFLRTDLYRIEAALEDAVWSDTVATRLREHIERLAGVLMLLTDASPDSEAPTNADSAIELLQEMTEALVEALATTADSRLDAVVLDYHDRNLTVLAHLYDYARLSAMLVEWSSTLPTADTVDTWFDALDDSP